MTENPLSAVEHGEVSTEEGEFSVPHGESLRRRTSPYFFPSEDTEELEMEIPSVEWPTEISSYAENTLAHWTLILPGMTLADLYRQTAGKPEGLRFGFAGGVQDFSSFVTEDPRGQWDAVKGFGATDKRCSVCQWKRHATGHVDGEECPDLIEYRIQYVELGRSIREIADFFDRPYSYIRQRLEWAGVELRTRGRRTGKI